MTTRWDPARAKLPTTAANKFEMITAHLGAVATRCGLRSVVLEEPGFHWVLPALRRRGIEPILCTIFEDGDVVQRDEIHRKHQGPDREAKVLALKMA